MIGATSWWCAMVNWPRLYHKTFTWEISLSILQVFKDTCPTWNLGLLWWFCLAIRVKTISSTFSGFHVAIFINLRTHPSFKAFWFTNCAHTPANEIGPKVLRASFGRFCDAASEANKAISNTNLTSRDTSYNTLIRYLENHIKVLSPKATALRRLTPQLHCSLAMNQSWALGT